MKLTVLVDNNTYIDNYYLGEPAVSYYIEAEGKKILFDTGYSDIYIQNAKKLKIDLSELDYIVLSHGHNDHTGGLRYFPYSDLKKECVIIMHPFALQSKRILDLPISVPILDFIKNKQKISLRTYKEPVEITHRLLFLSEIERNNVYENQSAVGETKVDEVWKNDFCLDDSALVYKSDLGLCIITGCSHAGICNIISYAKKVTGEERIYSVLGGLHLFDDKSNQTKYTINYLKESKPQHIYPCHCTSFKVRAAIHSQIPVHEVGVGLTINW